MEQVQKFETKEVIEYLSNQCEKEGYDFEKAILFVDNSNNWRKDLENLRRDYSRIFCCRDGGCFYAICFE